MKELERRTDEQVINLVVWADLPKTVQRLIKRWDSEDSII